MRERVKITDEIVADYIPFHTQGYRLLTTSQDGRLIMQRRGKVTIWREITSETNIVELWGLPVMFYNRTPYVLDR